MPFDSISSTAMRTAEVVYPNGSVVRFDEISARLITLDDGTVLGSASTTLVLAYAQAWNDQNLEVSVVDPYASVGALPLGLYSQGRLRMSSDEAGPPGSTLTVRFVDFATANPDAPLLTPLDFTETLVTTDWEDLPVAVSDPLVAVQLDLLIEGTTTESGVFTLFLDLRA